ncbi:MAG: hypothetical protein JWQ87_3829 [Candidatus Sulfotelmatobacter sp.]|nr:hypothetical protein [Candidatus Sulfotelmatobacter sp.]
MLLGLSILAGCSSSGGGGSTAAGPAPTVNLSISPTSIVASQSVTLTWLSTNAASVVIYANGSSLQAVQPVAGGSTTLLPTANTAYTLVATGNGQQTTSAAVNVSVTALNSFDGMPEPASAFGTKNPNDVDPYGAVGTKQFMEYVNTQYQAYSKAPPYTPVWSSPQSIGTPWNSLSPPSPCADPAIQLDAIVTFDRLAQRWVIAAKTTQTPRYYFCIAVSNTDDLSSKSLAWYTYYGELTQFLTVTKNGVTTVYQPDWPKFGTWTDSYYAAMDEIDVQIVNGVRQNTEVGVLACAFNRTQMLAGLPQSTVGFYPMECIVIPVSLDPSSLSYLGHSLIPADIDGTSAPPVGRDEFMVSIENPSIQNNATSSASINLWDFKPVNWAATPPALNAPTLTTLAVPTYNPGCYLFDPQSPTITNCILEPPLGTNPQYLDSNGDRLMPRFAYRNFTTTGYESYSVSHTVQTNLNSTQNPWQTGIRWYEMRPDSGGTPALYQNGLISPDDTHFRFLPTMAQDKNANAAVGYSLSSASTNPGIDFSYWNLRTPNAPTTEVTILSGPGQELTPSAPFAGEWGTYSSITVDPGDDCTFWYVNEYWPSGNASWATKISFFQLPGGCQ